MGRVRNETVHAAKRTEILRAAEALFVEAGFHQTGMAAICAAVGMSPGALYRYFPSKTAIIRAIVEEERQDAAARLDALDAAADLRAGLLDALDAAILAAADPDYGRLALEIGAEGARDAEIGALIEAGRAESAARLAAAIRRAGGPGADAEAAASILLAAIDGAAGGAGAALAALPEARRRAALGRLLDGLLGPA